MWQREAASSLLLFFSSICTSHAIQITLNQALPISQLVIILNWMEGNESCVMQLQRITMKNCIYILLASWLSEACVEIGSMLQLIGRIIIKIFGKVFTLWLNSDYVQFPVVFPDKMVEMVLVGCVSQWKLAQTVQRPYTHHDTIFNWMYTNGLLAAGCIHTFLTPKHLVEMR